MDEVFPYDSPRLFARSAPLSFWPTATYSTVERQKKMSDIRTDGRIPVPIMTFSTQYRESFKATPAYNMHDNDGDMSFST